MSNILLLAVLPLIMSALGKSATFPMAKSYEFNFFLQNEKICGIGYEQIPNPCATHDNDAYDFSWLENDLISFGEKYWGIYFILKELMQKELKGES